MIVFVVVWFFFSVVMRSFETYEQRGKSVVCSHAKENARESP